MDQIAHMSQKILAERARRMPQRQPPPDSAPPPYTSSDDDSDDSDDDEPTCPLNVTINAANSIRGSNNLVPTSASPLSDATKFSTILLHAIKQLNAASGSGRKLKVDLTINCGVTIVGDRNVVGSIGLRAKPQEDAIASADLVGSNVVAGAKRKAEEV